MNKRLRDSDDLETVFGTCVGCKAGGGWSQRETAETAQITEITIRNRYKEMMKRLLIVISL